MLNDESCRGNISEVFSRTHDPPSIRDSAEIFPLAGYRYRRTDNIGHRRGSLARAFPFITVMNLFFSKDDDFILLLPDEMQLPADIEGVPQKIMYSAGRRNVLTETCQL
jgi:hypothetical protein